MAKLIDVPEIILFQYKDRSELVLWDSGNIVARVDMNGADDITDKVVELFRKAVHVLTSDSTGRGEAEGDSETVFTA